MDIQKYTRIMESIKHRKEHIDWVRTNAGTMGMVSISMVESICLQLRMIIEDIAVACVVANAAELPALARSLRGEYRPSMILKGLEEMNPACYPIPIEENMLDSRGTFRDTRPRPEGDWLTRREAVQQYGKLGNVLHRNLKAYEVAPPSITDLYRWSILLESKILKLMSHHEIRVLEENTMYRVLMAGIAVDDVGTPQEGQIQVTQFEALTCPDCVADFRANKGFNLLQCTHVPSYETPRDPSIN